jgi:hypothetical protein
MQHVNYLEIYEPDVLADDMQPVLRYAASLFARYSMRISRLLTHGSRSFSNLGTAIALQRLANGAICANSGQNWRAR